MKEIRTSLSERESYVPNRQTRLLWWLSTAEAPLLQECMIDRNRYAIVGMTVLSTWLFATLAWGYFFSTVSGNILVVVIGGLVMGGIILSIDRALIKGISSANRKKMIPLGFRAILALTIGLFMAQPALLFLFDKEIHVQISLDNEKRKLDKKVKQDAFYATQKQQLIQERTSIKKSLEAEYQEVAAARENFIKETDGTGGSKKIGLKDIAAAKKEAYSQLDKDYRQKEALLLPQIKNIDSALAQIEVQKQSEQIAFNGLLNDGFITRMEALNQLIKQNDTVAFRYYLLVAILLLIEIMPVIAKSLLPAGSYDEKVKLRETLEFALTAQNHRRELELKEQYNQTAFIQNSQLIKDFFSVSNSNRQEKMKEQFKKWQTDDAHSFEQVWEKMKRDILTKEEN